MQIQQQISWPISNWPSGSPASQYTVLQVYPNTSPIVVATVSTTSATLTFDDAQNLAFQVRPSSAGPTYGPEVYVFVVGYVPCRAWLRQKIREALADRVDSASATANWPDDEINTYLVEAMNELNIMFPIEESTSFNLQPPTIDSHGNQVGVRDYSLPLDFYQARSIEYVTVDGKLHLYLKEKPFRGGESTATSYLGYPKLGIMLSPLAGRFYPGHYDVYGTPPMLHLDWDPAGDGDYLNIRYLGRRALPQNDGDVLSLIPEDMELLSLRVQMKCCLRIELQDVRLSRWRTKEDGSRRDDLPTIKQSTMIKQLYDQIVNDRRELRVKSRRLVRR